MARSNLKFNMDGWDEVARHVVRTEARPRMERVAEACNAELDPDGTQDGYKTSDDGDQPRRKRDYSATAITAEQEAIRHNAKHNTLIKNFHLAGGG